MRAPARRAICPRTRLAFHPVPAPAHAGSSSSSAPASPAGAPAPPGTLPPAVPLSALPVTDRVLHVAVATTSNLLNGAVFGALFGLVSGLWSSRALRPALAEARANGRSWAAISAVYAGLQTASKVVRARDDRFNALVGACGSGAAFTMRSGPAAAAQGCVSFAALSYVIDRLTASKTDLADQSDEQILEKKR